MKKKITVLRYHKCRDTLLYNTGGELDYCQLVKIGRFRQKDIVTLTPWYRVLLEKLTGLQLFKKFPAFHGTRMFINALTSVRHLSLSWASPIQPIYPHPTSWRSILILSIHLGLCLPSGSFPPVSPARPYTPPLLTHTLHMSKPSHSSRWWYNQKLHYAIHTTGCYL